MPSLDPIPLPPALRLLQRIEFPRKIGLCERFFARTLARRGIGWVRTASGPVWKLDLGNATHRWIVYGYYEGPTFWRWLRVHASDIRTVVDSGANIGQTVLYFARLLPQARILAYEPGQAARQWLRQCVEVNRFDQVSVEAAGLGAGPGTARLEGAGGTELHGSWNRIGAAEGETVDLVSLDAEMERHGLETVDLWKLDVEGYELEALRGAARALQAGRIRAVYLEVGETGDESLALLRQYGYAACSLGGRGAPSPSPCPKWSNMLFLAPGFPL